MSNKKTVIISAGGTGGHVFPAVAIADALHSSFNIQFVTDQRGLKYLGKYQKTAIIQNINTQTRIKLYLSVILNLVKGLAYLTKNRPICAIGFGGYPSVPFVLAAQFLHIKTFIHEQNAVMGLANKLLSKMATKTMLAFSGYGTPTRFEDTYNNFQYKPSEQPDFKMLVIGGSQGSQVVTKNVVNCLCSLPEDIKHNIFVHQQVRSENQNYALEMYEKNNISSEIRPFFNNMADLYKNTDLIISRSGASTVFEILGFKIPAFFIPFANSINGDQQANAEYIAQSGAAKVFREDDFDNLRDAIVNLYNNREELTSMSEALKHLHVKHSTELIVDTIHSYIDSNIK